MSQRTKTRILETALRLFNERGSGNVSTRHIAEELGMSPGNLYYHYPNKEAIIRALFDDLDATNDRSYRLADGESLSIDRIIGMLAVTFDIVWRFRFFYREMTLLIHNDPELAERYRSMLSRIERDTRAVIAAAIDKELIIPLCDEGRTTLTHTLMILSNHYLTFAEMRHPPLQQRHMKAGRALLLGVIEPYLAPTAQTQLSQSV